jgi:hypothetical protein
VSEKPEKFKRRDERRLEPRQVALFVGLWIVSGALSLADWVALRAAITAVVSAIVDAVPIEWQVQRQWYLRWTARAADPCSIAVLTVLAFLCIVGFDFLYREAIWKGKIRKTFITVTAIQVGLLALSWLAVTIASRIA